MDSAASPSNYLRTTFACTLLATLAACSGGGTSRGPGDEGVAGTPIPTLPSNQGPVLMGSLGAGSGSVRDEGVAADPYSIAALFAAARLSPAAGNTQSLASAIDSSGLPTSTSGAISDLAFTKPDVWPPASVADAEPLSLAQAVVDTNYAGAFDPVIAADQAWTRGWTLALDGTIARWRFFGGPVAPGTALFLSAQPLANDECPEGTSLTGRLSERIGALADDETGLFFNLGGDYDVCRLPERFDGTSRMGGTEPRLTNDNVYELADATGSVVGRGDTESTSIASPSGTVVLTVEPGTLIFAKPFQSLVVTRGSRIEASGLVSAPITFTSLQQLQARFDGDFATPASGDSNGWGGLVLMGRAPNAQCADDPCDVEDPRFGFHAGDRATDSSGTLRYVLIRNSGGSEPGVERDPPFPPALLLLSAGRGTLIDRVQTHRGRDAGVVIDGGNAFLTHTAITDQLFGVIAGRGWTGGLQHVLVIPGDSGSAGIALRGNDSSPVTFPLLTNLTVLGSTESALERERSLLVDTGSRAQIWNSIFTGDFPGGCVDLDDEATFQRAFEAGGAPPERPGPHLFFRNTVVDCTAVNFNENG